MTPHPLHREKARRTPDDGITQYVMGALSHTRERELCTRDFRQLYLYQEVCTRSEG